MSEDCLIKFIALGDSGVGKTSFLSQYSRGTFSPRFHATVGIDFEEKRLVYESIDGRIQRVRLQIWDPAGQERFRSLTTAFYRESMGFFLLFDLTDERSFLSIRNWLDELRLHSHGEEPEVILCGNKSDLEARRAISEQRARQFAEKYNLVYLEISAATGQNVRRAVHILLDRVMQRTDRAVEERLLTRTGRLKLSRRGEASPSSTEIDAVARADDDGKKRRGRSCRC